MALIFDETRSPAVVKVYNQNLVVTRVYQVGSGILLGVDFVTGVSGSESFILTFSDYADINKNDIIEIKVFGSSDNFFKGVVRSVPIKGSTDESFIYTGFGFSEYLGRISTESKTYTSETVEDIVEDLLDSIIVPKTPITKSVSLIDTTGVTVNSITFDYIQMDEALKKLKELAQASGNQYVTGVNEEGKFFFKERSQEVIKTLVVGKNSDIGIPTYNPSDENEARTKLYIKKSDGTFYGSVSSTEENDIFEETVTAPDIADADLTTWATGVLIEKETSTRKATIEWEIEKESPTFLTGDGKLRIVSNRPARNIALLGESYYGEGTYGSGIYGGYQPDSVLLDDTLRVLNVAYSINNNESKRTIQLGLDDPSLGLAVLAIRSELKDLKVSLGV